VSLIGLGAEGDHALIKDILAGLPVWRL
jgi:hypothetical protein